jgi:hypothetical protein
MRRTTSGASSTSAAKPSAEPFGAPPDVTTLPLAAVSVVLAVTLNLIAQHLFAGAAFWLSDAKSTWFLYQKLVFILGGMLLPIEVLPHGLEAVARFLPFVAMAYVPARLSSRHFESWLLALQVGWIVIAAIGATSSHRHARDRHRVGRIPGHLLPPGRRDPGMGHRPSARAARCAHHGLRHQPRLPPQRAAPRRDDQQRWASSWLARSRRQQFARVSSF